MHTVYRHVHALQAFIESRAFKLELRSAVPESSKLLDNSVAVLAWPLQVRLHSQNPTWTLALHSLEAAGPKAELYSSTNVYILRRCEQHGQLLPIASTMRVVSSCVLLCSLIVNSYAAQDQVPLFSVDPTQHHELERLSPRPLLDQEFAEWLKVKGEQWGMKGLSVSVVQRDSVTGEWSVEAEGYGIVDEDGKPATNEASSIPCCRTHTSP